MDTKKSQDCPGYFLFYTYFFLLFHLFSFFPLPINYLIIILYSPFLFSILTLFLFRKKGASPPFFLLFFFLLSYYYLYSIHRLFLLYLLYFYSEKVLRTFSPFLFLIIFIIIFPLPLFFFYTYFILP